MLLAVTALGVAGAATAQPAQGLNPSLKLGETTVIEFMDKMTPKRPVGCYTYTFTVQNAKPGQKLEFEMATAGGVLADCQVAILDANRLKRPIHVTAVSQLSPKQAGGLKWTMPEGIPQREVYVQLQCYSEGKVKVYLDWAK